MLKNTFCHIPGIGIKTETRLWSTGVRCWEDCQKERLPKMSPRKKETIKEYIRLSKENLSADNPNFFSELLPANLHWRLFPEFRKSVAYLDIETTGMDPYDGAITSVALFDGDTIYTFVKGQNLENLKELIKSYRVIVSYNGKCFDVPYIENHLGIKMDQAHIDLRYVLAALGYKGGLKACETALGLNRGDLKGVDGFFAVLLWHDYRINNNINALETMLAYNIYDAVNLETLMVIAYNMNLASTPFYETHRLPIPAVPEIPYKADMATVERIKNRLFAAGDRYYDEEDRLSD
jgi:uncharacterized protein YprB with RNaseH-like and TPR domain